MCTNPNNKQQPEKRRGRGKKKKKLANKGIINPQIRENNPIMIETVFTSQTLMGLISDTKSFESITDDYFKILDLDGDGTLSPSELRQGLNRVVAVESEVASREETDSVYEAIFERFGENLVPGKFRDLVSEILTAMARAFGNTPVIMVVHSDGLIMKAVRHESENAM
ncbi:Calcium-binding EF hand family protein [Hirschfeldia incana]|nr:Calcium-binding EF hand family protein [Hirschfeldia incana]